MLPFCRNCNLVRATMDDTGDKGGKGKPNEGPHPPKMNKKAKLREIEKCSTLPYPNAHFNMYNRRRKLLIFDINKVLLYRQAKTSYFKVRPYAHEFIAGMSERFTLAVWTSMTKKCAKPILAELFPRGSAPLLFNWYQTRCDAIANENTDEKPLFLKVLSRVWGEYRQYNESNTMLVDDSSEKCVRNPAHTSIQPHPYEPYGSTVRTGVAPVPSATLNNFDSAELDIDELNQPAKEVSFGATDDVVVAVAAGPIEGIGCVAVTPSASDSSGIEAAPESITQPEVSIATTSGVRTDEVVDSASASSSAVAGSVTSEVTGDVELKPDGPLWAYLDRIAQYDGSNKNLYDLYGSYTHQLNH